MTNWMGTADFAAHSGKNQDEVQKACTAGKLPAVKDGGRWKIDADLYDAQLRSVLPPQYTTSPQRVTRRRKRTA